MIEIIIRVNTLATEIERKQAGANDGKVGFMPGGLEIIEALTNYLKEEHLLLIGRLTAYATIISLCTNPEKTSMRLMGRSLDTGDPKAIEITTKKVEQAISKVIDGIVRHTAFTLIGDLTDFHQVASQVDQFTLTGEFRNVLVLKLRLEEAFGKPVLVTDY
ncbi:MAG: hypothetical protein DPW16_08565 [Chloroflexi bacterium]|nr:hypothetical protein [Chloroflexota bacterium]